MFPVVSSSEPNLFDIAISVTPRNRAWIFSSAVSSARPAKIGRSVCFTVSNAGWIGTTGVLAVHTGGWQRGGVGDKLGVIGFWGLVSSFFLLFAALGLVWGIRLLRRRERKLKYLLSSLVSAAALSPLYTLAGIAIIFLTPYVYGLVFHGSGKLVQSVTA